MDPESWGFEDTIDRYQEIAPIFNRNGQYYDRESKLWWFEHSGRAWTRNDGAKQFLWTLNAMRGTILSRREQEDLRRITNRTTSKALRHQIYKMLRDSDDAYLVLIGSSMENRVHMLRVHKRIRAMREEREEANG